MAGKTDKPVMLDAGAVQNAAIEMREKLWPIIAAAIGATTDARNEDGPLFTDITTEKNGVAVNGALNATAWLVGVLEGVCGKLGAPPHMIVQAIALGRHEGRDYFDNAAIDEDA